MPWKVFETGTDDKKFCIHKLNDDGSMGEKVACHATIETAKEQMQALYANMPEGEKRAKAMSLTEQVRDIEAAWNQQHPMQPKPMIEAGWITEVFEDYAIAYVDGKYYRVPFTVVENEIIFAMTDWVEVEEKKEWIEKSKKLKLKSHSMRVKVAVGKKHIIRRSTTIEETTKRAKAFDEYSEDAVFNVLGVPFGGHLEGRDREGEAFTKSTDTWLNVGDSVPCTYYHGFGPDDPEEVQDPPVIIGRAKFTGSDKRGHWFDTRLDPDEPLAARLLEDGAELRASTGAVSHLVRMKAGGLIAVWPVAELALFDVNDWRQPANDLAVVERKITQEPEGAAEADGAKGAPKQSVVIPKRQIQKRALQLLAKISVEG